MICLEDSEIEARQIALSHATHTGYAGQDSKTDNEIIECAQKYYEFLTNTGEGKPNA